jgi:hypothetical protein
MEKLLPTIGVCTDKTHGVSSEKSTSRNKDGVIERKECPYCCSKLLISKYANHLLHFHSIKIENSSSTKKKRKHRKSLATRVNKKKPSTIDTISKSQENKYTGLTPSQKKVVSAVDLASTFKRVKEKDLHSSYPQNEDAMEHAYFGGGFETSRKKH